MPANVFIGEFEQLVLLTVLQLDSSAYALPLREKLSEMAGRTVSRGALYRTLDRLEEKGFVVWEVEENLPERGGHPRRCFAVTAAGLNTLRASRNTLLRVWSGLEDVLE